MSDVQLINADCREAMADLSENSIDTIITDPPYGLDFMGKDWDSGVPGVRFWQAALRTLKPGGTLLAFGGTRTYHRLAVAIEDAGFEIRDCIFWIYGSGFPKSHNIGKGIDKAAGARGNDSVGFNVAGKTSGLAPIQRQELRSDNKDYVLPKSILPQAQLWDGWGTALKPACEPIVVAMKPREGTFAENALKWGVAGINVDGGRIGTDGGTQCDNRDSDGSCFGHPDANGSLGGGVMRHGANSVPKGRWPANVILDEDSAEVMDEQSGVRKGGYVMNRTAGARPFNNDGKDTGYETTAKINEPSGGASRFFYVAKAGRKERNAGLGDEPNPMKGQLPNTDDRVPKTRPVQNAHPTVKPLKLMRYLCKLTATPTGGTVLDPFMGSGSTGVACVQTGRDFIGIELEKDYVEIADRRIENAQTTGSLAR